MLKLKVDKSKFGPGPWQEEADKEMWYDAATGLRCMIRRAYTMGQLNGYVRIPQRHPWYKRHYTTGRIESKLSVHGGITFSGTFRDEDGWWIGFDCGHYMDSMPGMQALLRPRLNMPFQDTPETYRTSGYVRLQCKELAKQIDVAAVGRVQDKVGLRYALRDYKLKAMELQKRLKRDMKVRKMRVEPGQSVTLRLVPPPDNKS